MIIIIIIVIISILIVVILANVSWFTIAIMLIEGRKRNSNPKAVFLLSGPTLSPATPTPQTQDYLTKMKGRIFLSYHFI